MKTHYTYPFYTTPYSRTTYLAPVDIQDLTNTEFVAAQMVPLFELGHCAVIFCGYPAEVVTLFDLVNDSGLSPALLYVLEHLGVKKLARAVEIERIRLRGEEWPGPGIRKIEYAGAAVPGDYVVGVLRVEQFDGF